MDARTKYDKQNTVTVSLKLNKKTDADIIAWVQSQESKQGAIKAAVRQSLRNTKASALSRYA